jgi:hypothetical protein
MSRWARALVGAVAVFATLSGAARASDFHYPRERDALSNPLVSRAVDAGIAFWASQGVTVCPRAQLVVRMAPDLDGAEGRASDCDIWITQEDVEFGNSLGWSPVAELCNTVLHELAHTPPAGLTHEQMAPYEQAKRAACWRVADRVARAASRERRLARRPLVFVRFTLADRQRPHTWRGARRGPPGFR